MAYECKTGPAAELRFDSAAEGTFSGYASVFGEPDSYGDVIQPGAFRGTLEGRSTGPAMFWNHDPAQPVGVWTSVAEDRRGLAVTGRLVTETRAGAEAFALLKAGAVNGLSIGFRARNAKRSKGGTRVLTDIDLVEISLVTLPAASNARVTSVRHAVQPARNAAFIQAARRAATALKG